MSVNVSDVKRLNERIEAIQRKADRAKSQSEVFLAKLNKEIADYENKYGVKLSGKSIDETMQLIEAESKKVSSAINEEYSLKLKVVDAIDRGDIAEASRLLGVSDKNDSEKSELDLSEEDTIDENMQSNVAPTDKIKETNNSYSVVSSGSKSLPLSNTSSTEIKDRVSVTAKKGIILDEPDENVKPANITFDAGDMSFDDEFDDSDGDLNSDVSSDNNETDSVEINNVSDSSDDDDEFDFGFGALLKGTKFGN